MTNSITFDITISDFMTNRGVKRGTEISRNTPEFSSPTRFCSPARLRALADNLIDAVAARPGENNRKVNTSIQNVCFAVIAFPHDKEYEVMDQTPSHADIDHANQGCPAGHQARHHQY
jgi:hypothetical protein